MFVTSFQTAADEFYRNFNGVSYNSLEPETCRLVYVSRVDLVNESDEARLPIPGTARGRVTAEQICGDGTDRLSSQTRPVGRVLPDFDRT